MPAVGEVYRDTTMDNPPRAGSKSYHNFDSAFYAARTHRTIRLLERLPDGKWLVQGVTDHLGNVVERGRKTRVGPGTLAANYVLVTAPTPR